MLEVLRTLDTGGKNKALSLSTYQYLYLEWPSWRQRGPGGGRVSCPLPGGERYW